MIDEGKRNRLLMVVGGLLAIVILIILIFFVIRPKAEFEISNINECSEGIDSDSKEILYGDIMKYLKIQNRRNNKGVSAPYVATFRKETCKTEVFDRGNGKKSYTTRGTIDIEKLGYSFIIRYTWTKGDGSAPEIDKGSATITCPKKDDLKYSETCDDVEEFKEPDPLLYVLPYTGKGYYLIPRSSDTSASGYAIEISLDPSESVYLEGRVAAYRSQKTQEAEAYLKEKGINLDDYEIKVTYRTIY